MSLDATNWDNEGIFINIMNHIINHSKPFCWAVRPTGSEITLSPISYVFIQCRAPRATIGIRPGRIGKDYFVFRDHFLAFQLSGLHPDRPCNDSARVFQPHVFFSQCDKPRRISFSKQILVFVVQAPKRFDPCRDSRAGLGLLDVRRAALILIIPSDVRAAFFAKFLPRCTWRKNSVAFNTSF